MHLLLLNPNSCSDLTDALERLLVPPPDVCLSFLTADARLGAPAAIDDEPSADRSTVACLRLVQEDPTARELVRATDGVLVCCCKISQLLAGLGRGLSPGRRAGRIGVGRQGRPYVRAAALSSPGPISQ